MRKHFDVKIIYIGAVIILLATLICQGFSGYYTMPVRTINSNPRLSAGDDYDSIRNFKGLAVTFNKSNGWESNGSYYAQFNVSVENHNNYDVNSWHFAIPYSGQINKDNAWNCNLDISNNLNIYNADYNGNIAAKSTITEVGMILAANNSSSLDSLVGTYLIDNSTGVGRVLSADEVRAFREGTADVGGSNTNPSDTGEGGAEPSNPEGGNVNPPNPTPVVPKVPEVGTPFDNHGALAVSGVDLVDSNGSQYQLRGVSTHGLQWFPEYVNEGAFKCLRDDWGANVVRLAMYTDEGGYCAGGDKAKLESIIDKGVNAATGLGMYVIIDWHILQDSNPMQHQAEAIDFFSRISARYSSHSNVLYEICNEPNGGTNWDTIKQYADSVIPVIRANDSDAIILVGTPTWSQDVEQVSANPLRYNNVMYTLHFYAGTHKDNIRNKLIQARAAGTPVFVSEFSICDASGNGGIDYASADVWKSLINDTNVSFVGWSLCNKNETSALIKSSCGSVDKFSENDLSDTGIYLRNWCLTQSLNDGDEVIPEKEGANIMFRMFNPYSGEHLYTASNDERKYLVIVGWRYEGCAWYAPIISDTPVYRLYNPYSGDHHYTADVIEKDILDFIGWNYEGVGWYSADPGEAVYRLFNPNVTGVGSHHYTRDVVERNHLSFNGWNYEGIGWYGV